MKSIKKSAAVIVAVALTLSGLVTTRLISAFASETIEAAQMHIWEAYYSEVMEEGITDSYGNSYETNVVKFDNSLRKNGYISYDLNGEYSRFNGYFVSSSDSSSEGELNAAIFADGELVYSITDYTRQKPKQEFNIDLTGVKLLEIKTSNDEFCASCWLFMVDSVFTKADTPSAAKNWATTRDCALIDSDSFEQQDTLQTDSFGTLHDGATKFNSYYDGYGVYNLNKEYTTFTGAFVAGTDSDTDSEAVMSVNVYCDDELVFSASDITRLTPAVEFELDVTNVSILKIETSSEGTNINRDLYLVDDILTDGTYYEDTSAAAAFARINQQPEDVTVDEGDMIIMSVGATGLDLSYQWQYRKSGEEWQDWEGYTDKALEAEATAEEDRMLVRCKVTDSYGSTIISDVKVICVNLKDTGSASAGDNTTVDFIEVSAGDVNGDDVIDMKDVITLKRHVAGWNVTLKYLTCVADAE